VNFLSKERELMGKRLKVPLAVGLGLLAALVAATALSSAAVSFRSAERDGARVAEVLIEDRVVIVVRTSAGGYTPCLLYTSPSPRDRTRSRMPSSA